MKRNHRSITNELARTYEQKNHDYEDSFTESLDEFGMIAAIIRIGDKFNRLKSLNKKDGKVSDETVRDTVMDLANYSIMLAMWLDEESGNSVETNRQ